MEPVHIAIFLKPFAAVLLLWLFLAPIRRLFLRYFPDGKLKRLLLYRLS
jgi:hypothetical protein